MNNKYELGAFILRLVTGLTFCFTVFQNFKAGLKIL